MKPKFQKGDKVSWNSEAGRVSGTIIKIHTKDFDYKGYTHHASEDSYDLIPSMPFFKEKTFFSGKVLLIFFAASMLRFPD